MTPGGSIHFANDDLVRLALRVGVGGGGGGVSILTTKLLLRLLTIIFKS